MLSAPCFRSAGAVRRSQRTPCKDSSPISSTVQFFNTGNPSPETNVSDSKDGMGRGRVSYPLYRKESCEFRCSSWSSSSLVRDDEVSQAIVHCSRRLATRERAGCERRIQASRLRRNVCSESQGKKQCLAPDFLDTELSASM